MPAYCAAALTASLCTISVAGLQRAGRALAGGHAIGKPALSAGTDTRPDNVIHSGHCSSRHAESQNIHSSRVAWANAWCICSRVAASTPSAS